MSRQATPSRSIAMRGVLVLGISQWTKIGAQFAGVVLLSRFLTPGDFGITASVAPLIAFMAIFQDLGLQQAIIQRSSITQEDLTSIFWLTVLLGCVLTLALLGLSPAAAWFFHDRRLLWVTAVSSIPVLISSLAAVPSAVLNRQGRFGVLAQNDVMTSVASVLTAVVAALLGCRYWSLIIATIVTNALSTVFLACRADWLPGRPRFQSPERDLIHFGSNLTGFTLVQFFARNADNLLIGHAWGVTALGYYDRAYKILLLPIQSISAPVSRVMIPLLSRIEADKPRFRSVYLRVVTLIGLTAVPGMAALVATAASVISLLFGARWAAVTPIFLWLGIASLIQPINNTAGLIFICQARTQAMFRLGMFTSSTAVLSFLIGLKWGVVGVAASYAISDYVVRLPVQYWSVGRVGPVSVMDLASIQAPLLVSAGITWVISHQVLAGSLRLTGPALIAATVLVSYALSALAIASVHNGRVALREGMSMVVQVLIAYRRKPRIDTNP